MKILVKFILIITMIFSSCVSTRDISISGNQRTETEMKLSELEAVIVPLEAAQLEQRAQKTNLTASELRTRQNELALARQSVTQMEKENSADHDYSGKLAAWSGRLALIEGKTADAQRLYKQSISASPANIPAVILSIRLETNPAKRLELINKELSLITQKSPGAGELNIEKGSTLYEMQRFSEAVGAFDIAFSSNINDIYRTSYTAERNRAFELRSAAGTSAGTLSTIGRESVTWLDLISIIKNESQLLNFLTAGRNISNIEIYNHLVERGFIPLIQDVTVLDWSSEKPKADESVSRAGAAWLIWHLHAESNADRGLLTRYSAQYSARVNPRNPIPDVPILSPFFDSVLGCVESEFMQLPDGRNFRPVLYIRSTEVLAILKKIDK